MKLLFDEDVENFDFIEIILSLEEYEKLLKKEVAEDFKGGLYGIRNLNICVRVKS